MFETTAKTQSGSQLLLKPDCKGFAKPQLNFASGGLYIKKNNRYSSIMNNILLITLVVNLCAGYILAAPVHPNIPELNTESDTETQSTTERFGLNDYVVSETEYQQLLSRLSELANRVVNGSHSRLAEVANEVVARTSLSEVAHQAASRVQNSSSALPNGEAIRTQQNNRRVISSDDYITDEAQYQELLNRSFDETSRTEGTQRLADNQVTTVNELVDRAAVGHENRLTGGEENYITSDTQYQQLLDRLSEEAVDQIVNHPDNYVSNNATIEAILHQIEEKNGEADCSICLEPIRSSSSTKFHCKHEFHDSCAQKWSQESSRCPVCRQQLRLQNGAYYQAPRTTNYY